MTPKILFTALVFMSGAAWSALPATLSGENLADAGKVHVATVNKDTKGTVVVFLSASCPCSNSHVAGLKELAEKYKEFKFVGVHSNIDENLAVSKMYFSAMAIPFPVIQDDKAVIADAFKALKTPHAYILSPHGEILFQGGVTNSANGKDAQIHYLADALEDLRHDRKIKNTNARTLGCVIMREKNSW